MTDDGVLAGRDWVALARRVMEAGRSELAVHVRGRRTTSRTLLGLVDDLLPHAHRTGAALIVNDRVDVALVSGADGVHLGTGSLAVADARRILGPDARIGVSCHEAREVEAAAVEGADYVFLGTIHATPSHPGVDGMGIGALGRIAAEVAVPLIGIGGIGPGEGASVAAAGAYGVAAIRGIWEAEDPAEATRRYLEGLGQTEVEDLGSDGHDSNPTER